MNKKDKKQFEIRVKAIEKEIESLKKDITKAQAEKESQKEDSLATFKKLLLPLSKGLNDRMSYKDIEPILKAISRFCSELSTIDLTSGGEGHSRLSFTFLSKEAEERFEKLSKMDSEDDEGFDEFFLDDEDDE